MRSARYQIKVIYHQKSKNISAAMRFFRNPPTLFGGVLRPTQQILVGERELLAAREEVEPLIRDGVIHITNMEDNSYFTYPEERSIQEKLGILDTAQVLTPETIPPVEVVVEAPKPKTTPDSVLVPVVVTPETEILAITPTPSPDELPVEDPMVPLSEDPQVETLNVLPVVPQAELLTLPVVQDVPSPAVVDAVEPKSDHERFLETAAAEVDRRYNSKSKDKKRRKE